MSKRLIAVLALALVVGLTFTAYAEVQNVKVSGDLNLLGIARNQFDLARGVKDNKSDDSESFFATQLRLRVDADLTDNVGVTMRLINERSWNTEDGFSDNTGIAVDLAYVTLKEFLYSPLSVTVGRQELKYGNQLIIGNAGTYAAGALSGVPSDLSVRKAFDGIKATLNYDPLVVDLFYAKIDENTLRSTATVGEKDDVDLYGIYATYDINKKLSADVYGMFRNDSVFDKNNKTYVLGSLIRATPVEDLKTSLEAAIQLGNMRNAASTSTATTTGNDKRLAYAIQAMADYTFSKVKMTPMIGAAYTYLSGDKNNNTGKRAWNQMYYNQSLNNIAYAIIPFSNLSVLNIKGSVKPMDDVTVSLNYGWYRRAKKNTDAITSPATSGNEVAYDASYVMNDKKALGNEIDLTVTYDYTEDVQLGLTGGWFKPGKAFDTVNRRDATQLIGSMKVTF